MFAVSPRRCTCNKSAFAQLLALPLLHINQFVQPGWSIDLTTAGTAGLYSVSPRSDALRRLPSKTDDELTGISASALGVGRSALSEVIEPVRSILVAQLEGYGGKTYGRLADAILAIAALFVAHLVVWFCVYGRRQFDLAEDGRLSVMQQGESDTAAVGGEASMAAAAGDRAAAGHKAGVTPVNQHAGNTGLHQRTAATSKKQARDLH